MKDLKTQIKKSSAWFYPITYAVALVFIVMNFSSILSIISFILGLLQPFFYGILLAFVLNIIMKKIESFLKKHIKESNWFYGKIRGISVTLSLIVAILIVVILVAVIMPQIITSVVSLFQNLAVYANGLLNNIGKIYEFFDLTPPDITVNNATFDQMFASLGLDWNNIINNLGNVVAGTGNNVVTMISQFSVQFFNWFMGLMISIYLLMSKETFIRQGKKIVAAIFSWKTTQKIMHVFSVANDTFQLFVSGQLISALIIGFCEYFFLMIAGIPFAVLNGCLAAVMALIPIFGGFIGCVVGALLVVAVDPIKAIWFIIIYQAVQQIYGSLVYPRIVGKSVGLPGLWTLLSIVVFGGIFGFVGMLMAVPLTAVLYSFGTEIVNENLKKKSIVVTTNEVFNTSHDNEDTGDE